MFERVEAQVRAAAEARVRARVAELAASEMPAGVRVEAAGDRLVLTGRGLGRRRVTDPALRGWPA